MKRSVLLSMCFMFFAPTADGQDYAFPLPAYTPDSINMAAREEFRNMKFGLFIHWGIYSGLGDGEWVMHNRKIPYDNYKRLAGFFNPQGFNAREWVQIVKKAGMKYITITSRHHDGFSMFKTQASVYNIVDATPYHKDPLMELAQEAQKEGIGLHFYYSLLDWGRPDYGYSKSIVNGKPADTDWESYITFMKKQLTELINNYPNVTGIWLDGHWDRPAVNWHYNELYTLIHQLNPAILIGNNHHRTPFSGEDFQLFEKDLPGENKTGYRSNTRVAGLPLETCETINNSWGFNINDRNYKSVKQIIQLLVGAAGRNANFLLNVGPIPDGKIQTEFTDTLAVVGEWLKKNGKTLYDTRAGETAPQEWGVVTAKDKTMYVHILKRPAQQYLFIPLLNKTIKWAVSFKTRDPLKFKQYPEGVFIYLDNMEMDTIDTILELETINVRVK